MHLAEDANYHNEADSHHHTLICFRETCSVEMTVLVHDRLSAGTTYRASLVPRPHGLGTRLVLGMLAWKMHTIRIGCDPQSIVWIHLTVCSKFGVALSFGSAVTVCQFYKLRACKTVCIVRCRSLITEANFGEFSATLGSSKTLLLHA